MGLLPWKISFETEISEGYDEWHIRDAEGKIVTTIANEKRPEAIFIVRAVNCHQVLVDAINEALLWLDPDCSLDGETACNNLSDRENMIIGLYEALAKTEGK